MEMQQGPNVQFVQPVISMDAHFDKYSCNHSEDMLALLKHIKGLPDFYPWPDYGYG